MKKLFLIVFIFLELFCHEYAIGETLNNDLIKGIQLITTNNKFLILTEKQEIISYIANGDHIFHVVRGVIPLFSKTNDYAEVVIPAMRKVYPFKIGNSETFKISRDGEAWFNTIKVVREATIDTPIGKRQVFVVLHEERGMGNNSFREVYENFIDKDLDIKWEQKVINYGGTPSLRKSYKVIDVKFNTNQENVLPSDSIDKNNETSKLKQKNEIVTKEGFKNEPAIVQNGTPPRAAAIGNVDVPVKAPVGQSVPGQPTQLTSNPIDQQKKTSNNEIWVSFNPSITVQERQFCRIIENFRAEKAIAEQSKNQIKINETFKSLVQSLNSLLPDGKFQGWIMRTVYVAQASDGSAEVLLELPCNVYVGSNACDADPQKFYGTAPEGTRMYTELAKMSVGDFALTSGQFVYIDDKAFDKNRSVASFRYLKTASHCRAKEMPADTDFFGLKLDVISTMK